MQKEDLTFQQYEELCIRIFKILTELGPAQTTMDLLAKRLSISKRTLYEIFGSKDEMLVTLMNGANARYAKEVQKIVATSENVMEALAEILLIHQRAILDLSPNFFRDMDARYSYLRGDYDKNSYQWSGYIARAIKEGISQGVFRADVNYEVTLRLLRVQMESLKRMEEFFPPEITLLEAYNAIALGLMRSIATPKGSITLEKIEPKFK